MSVTWGEVRSQGMRQVWHWSFGLTLVSLGVAGCSSLEGRQSGAASPEEAVTVLLVAAAESDVQAACAVTTEMKDEDLKTSLDIISGFVRSAGGIEALSVQEEIERQMRSMSFVVVGVVDSTAQIELEVLQSGGRYLVATGGEEEADDGPTSDPRPPTEKPLSNPFDDT